ncbi:MAG: LysR substrate-binding domain-containing protein [Pseudoxanthomonas sp.]
MRWISWLTPRVSRSVPRASRCDPRGIAQDADRARGAVATDEAASLHAFRTRIICRAFLMSGGRLPLSLDVTINPGWVRGGAPAQATQDRSMNFQQLRAVQEAIRQNFNLTEVAESLHASQSAISRQIRELEEELGVDIFRRHGKRLIDLTPPGREISVIVDRILKDRDSLRRASDEYRLLDGGKLSVAAPHAQVRYRLPATVKQFRQDYPSVHLTLRPTPPGQIADLVRDGAIDIGFVPEGLPCPPELVLFKAYTWTHCFVVPEGHPLLRLPVQTLADIATYPVITFEEGMIGRAHINEAFEKLGLKPDIVISAVDSDVIKTYVELGLGVGIIAERAFNNTLDSKLVCLNARASISPVTTYLAVRRGTYLRGYMLAFIQALIPDLSTDEIRQQVEASAVPASNGHDAQHLRQAGERAA